MTSTQATQAAPTTAAPTASDLDAADLVLTFVKLSDQSRRQGLLSLEEETWSLTSQDLRDAIQEVIDGSPPQVIAQVLDYRLEELRERREAELRRELAYLRLVKTGVLAIQRGDPPRLVRTLLEAQLPPDERTRAQAAVATYTPLPRLTLPPAPGWSEEDLADLKLDSIQKLSDRDMIRVTRELGQKDVALALRSAPDEIRQRFFKAMSRRAAEHLRDTIELIGPQHLSAIEEAQQRIVSVMRRLAEAGEIGGSTR